MSDQHDPLTQHQLRVLGALFPDDIDGIRDLVRTGAGWLTFHDESAGLAVLLHAYGGQLCGWAVFPAASRRTAEVAGRCMRAGFDMGAREVLDVAADLAQGVLDRAKRH